MKIVTLGLFIIFIIYTQNYAQVKYYYPALLQNIHIDSYNSIGFSNMTNTQISEIASSNPATLTNFSSVAGGIGFEYATKIDYYYGIELDRAKQWLPATFGIVYPYNNFRIGLGYFQKYSSFTSIELRIRTPFDPDDTGELLKASSDVVFHNPSLLFSYSVDNLLQGGDKFSVGGQLFWDFWEQEEKMHTLKGNISANSLTWKIGLLYKFISDISIGAFFEKGIDMEGELKYNSDNQFFPDPDSSNNIKIGSSLSSLVLFKLPHKLSFGFYNELTSYLSFSSNLTVIFWSDLDKIYEDQLDFSANTLISISEMFDFTLGIYATDRKIVDKYYNFNNPQNATYFDVGFKTKIDNITLHAEILDSYLFSTEKRKQTIYKIDFNYELNN